MTKTFAPETLDRIDREIGQRLRKARKARGRSQTQLGEILGVSFQQIQKYERGTNRLSSSAAVAICSALGLAWDDLFGPQGVEPGSQPPEPLQQIGEDPMGARLADVWPALDAEDRRALTRLAEKLSRASNRILSIVATDMSEAA